VHRRVESKIRNTQREAEQRSEVFFSGALGRIKRIMLVVGPIAVAASWARFGWRVALGLACGVVIAWVNFHWLERVVSALADSVTQQGRKPSGVGVFLRFTARYLLVGLAAYVIFKSYPASVYGLLAGLFLPVAAIACEAVYEVYAALRRGV
jgi:small-conductance mechanosensitive channel